MAADTQNISYGQNNGMHFSHKFMMAHKINKRIEHWALWRDREGKYDMVCTAQCTHHTRLF